MHESIIIGCKQGIPAMQRRLFEMFAPVMMTVCRRYTADSAAAEDVLQEAFIKVFRSFDRFDPSRGVIEAWIRRIVVNTAVQHWRHQQRHNTWLTDTPVPDVPEAEDPPEMLFTEEELLSLINQLPPGFKMVFNLCVLEGFSHAEVAKELGITESTSRSQLARARKLLQAAVNAFKLEANERF
jgi:RNA polymerase sigma factor (sigma-70 family)